jgi:hypothetical protein
MALTFTNEFCHFLFIKGTPTAIHSAKYEMNEFLWGLRVCVLPIFHIILKNPLKNIAGRTGANPTTF